MNLARVVAACCALSLHRLVHLAPHAYDRDPTDTVAVNGVPKTFMHNVLFVVIDACALVYQMAQSAPIDLADVLLVAIMILSVALRYWCYHKLGRLFTYTILVKPNHELVRDGPYTLLLHPSYTAQVGVMCCYLLFMFRWKTLFWLPLIAYVLHKLGQRMRIEEDHLSRLLPAYDAYKQERWRLIPFVY